MKKFILSFLTAFFTLTAFAQNDKIDSLKRLLPEQQGKEKLATLNALTKALGIAERYNEIEGFAKEAYSLAESLGDTEGFAIANKRLGALYFIKGNYADGEKYTQVALKYFEQTTELDEVLILYNNMSSSGYSQGKFTDALSWNDKSMAIVKKVNEEDLTIETMTYRALIFQGMNRAEEALAVFSEIFDKYTQNNQAEESARILVNMAEIYAKKGNLAEAIKKYEASYAIREKIPNFNPVLMGYLCRRLINLYAELKEYQTAFSYAVKAYQFYEQANDQEELDECLTDLFKLAYENKDLEGSIDYSKKLLEIYKKRGDLKSIADKSTNIGILYKEKGDNETSLNYLNEALATLEKIGDKEAIAAICVNLGEAYHALGKDDKSLEVLERSYQIRAEMGVPDRVYHACNNLMILFKEINNCSKVLEYAQLAAPYIAKATIEQASLIRHYEMIGACAYEFMQSDLLIEAQKNLIRLHEQSNQKPKLLQSYINSAVYLKENKRYEEALSYFEKVTALAADLNMKVELAGCYYEMGEINILLDNYAAAADYLKKSIALREGMPNQNEPLVTLYGYLAQVLTLMENCKEAIGYHEKALALVAREEEKQEIRKLIEECQKKLKNR